MKLSYIRTNSKNSHFTVDAVRSVLVSSGSTHEPRAIVVDTDRNLSTRAPTNLNGEEFFLSKQLSDKGMQTWYDPAIKLTHCYHGSLQNAPSQAERCGSRRVRRTRSIASSQGVRLSPTGAFES